MRSSWGVDIRLQVGVDQNRKHPMRLDGLINWQRVCLVLREFHSLVYLDESQTN